MTETPFTGSGGTPSLSCPFIREPESVSGGKVVETWDKGGCDVRWYADGRVSPPCLRTGGRSREESELLERGKEGLRGM